MSICIKKIKCIFQYLGICLPEDYLLVFHLDFEVTKGNEIDKILIFDILCNRVEYQLLHAVNACIKHYFRKKLLS